MREVEAGTAFLKAFPPRPDRGEVLLPGEPERITRVAREAGGIPVDRTTWALLVDAASLVGVRAETGHG